MKKSCKYGEYGLFEHVLFLFCFKVYGQYLKVHVNSKTNFDCKNEVLLKLSDV